MSLYRYRIYSDGGELFGYLFREENGSAVNLLMAPDAPEMPDYIERDTCIRPLERFLNEPVEVRDYWEDNEAPQYYESLNRFLDQLGGLTTATFEKVADQVAKIERPINRDAVVTRPKLKIIK